MRYLNLDELLELHRIAIATSGGASGVRYLAGLESALAQPYMTFGGQDLYPTVWEKAAALAFSLIMNHPFLDGNKRIGHAAMETFLILNGYELSFPVEEQERIVLDVAAGKMTQESFADWVHSHVIEKASS